MRVAKSFGGCKLKLVRSPHDVRLQAASSRKLQPSTAQVLGDIRVPPQNKSNEALFRKGVGLRAMARKQEDFQGERDAEPKQKEQEGA